MSVTHTTMAAVSSQVVLAVGDELPPSVTANITQIGGRLVFLVDFLAAMHLVYFGASFVLQHLSDHRLPVPAGQWFTKIMAGIWLCAAAGTIAAVVIGT